VSDAWESWNRAQLDCECETYECCDACRDEPDKQAMIADFERDVRLTDG
jgi:hypothetical protein